MSCIFTCIGTLTGTSSIAHSTSQAQEYNTNGIMHLVTYEGCLINHCAYALALFHTHIDINAITNMYWWFWP